MQVVASTLGPVATISEPGLGWFGTGVPPSRTTPYGLTWFFSLSRNGGRWRDEKLFHIVVDHIGTWHILSG